MNLSENSGDFTRGCKRKMTPTPFMKLDISTTHWIYFHRGKAIFLQTFSR